jgi:hypothetical protein
VAKEPLQQAVDAIRKLATAQEYVGLPDDLLLKRFLAARDRAGLSRS